MLLNGAIMLNYAHSHLATIMLKLCWRNPPRPKMHQPWAIVVHYNSALKGCLQVSQ